MPKPSRPRSKSVSGQITKRKGDSRKRLSDVRSDGRDRALSSDSLSPPQDSEKAPTRDAERISDRRKPLDDLPPQSDSLERRDRLPKASPVLASFPRKPKPIDAIAPIESLSLDAEDFPEFDRPRGMAPPPSPQKPLSRLPRGTPTILDDIVTQIQADLSPAFQRDHPPDLDQWINLDPFGQISRLPDSPLKDYAFDRLDADKVADFLRKISLTRQQSAPSKLMPLLSDLANPVLSATPLSSGIPPLQHSVWVGNPLDAAIPKQRAFMDALAKNKRDNPGWTVVLWTDQSRDTVNDAAPDSLVGRMRQWAADNDIVLANIDEVFAGKNKMQLHDICNLERNKGGTGRAAASDIIRLEILNRFGGMYVDGDKAINIPLPDIAEAASKNVIRLPIPIAEVPPGATVRPAVSPAEQAAEQRGMVIVEVTGFAAGNAESGRYQNCALCSEKDSLVIDRIIHQIRDNYRKNRNQLKGLTGLGVDSLARAQRMEVITRTGPSVVRDTVDPKRQGWALMPLGSVNTYTGTTSWTGEKSFTGGQDPTAFVGRVQDLLKPEALKSQAKLALSEPPKLPSLSALAPERATKIATAVKNSLTALSYTIPNEMGRLDLNYLKPHLIGLSSDEQMLAIHATLQTLSQLAGLAGAVTTLRLPTLRDPKPDDLMLAVETLDLIRSGALPNLNLQAFTLQDAALEGHLTFLGYAQRQGLLDDLNIPASQRIDAGTDDSNNEAGGFHDVVQAAIAGGHRQVIHYLASLDAFENYTGVETAFQKAAQYGQIDTVIAFAEARTRPDSIKILVKQDRFPGNLAVEVLERYRSTFDDSLDVRQASAALLEKVISARALDQVPKLQELGVDMSHCSPQERSRLLWLMVRGATDDASADTMLNTAALLGIEDELLIQAGKDNNPNLITAQLNKTRLLRIPVGNYDAEAELAVAHARFPNAEASKNEYKRVDIARLQLDDARSLVQKALVYSHDRLRAGEEGKASRIRGWHDLLELMKSQEVLNGDRRLLDMIDHAQQQLDDMTAPIATRTLKRRVAAQFPSPDLSQRQPTTRRGKIRAFFKADPIPVASPDDEVFVPGKGMRRL